MLTGDPRLHDIVENVKVRSGDRALLLAGLVLAEEAGEAVQQLRRALGLARSGAAPADVAAELADVVISAFIIAELLAVDLDRAVSEKLSLGVR